MKKFTISSDGLGKAFKKLALAVNPKHTLPVLKNIRCKITGASVELVTSDTELTIQQCCAAAETGGNEFEMLLPFDFLSRIISLTKGPITVEHPSARKARILGDGDTYDISLDRLEDYPQLPAVSPRNSISLDLNFVDFLTKAMHSTSSDEKFPALMNVCVDVSEKDLHVVSTDRYTFYKHRVPVGTKTPEQVLIPARTVKVIEGVQNLEMSWNSKQVCLKSGELTVWTRRFDGKFVDYKAALADRPVSLTIDRAAMVDALHKTALAGGTPNITTIHLKHESGRILLECIDPEMGRSVRIDKPAEYTGKVNVIHLNTKNMLTVLGQLSSEKVCLHITDPGKPVLISTQGDTDYQGLIIPYVNNPQNEKN